MASDYPTARCIAPDEVLRAQYQLEVVELLIADVTFPTSIVPAVNLDDITALGVDVVADIASH